jgi:hypothetical protein
MAMSLRTFSILALALLVGAPAPTAAQPITVGPVVELEPPLSMRDFFTRVVPLTVSSALVLAGERPPREIGWASQLVLVDRLDGVPRVTSLPVRSGGWLYHDQELAVSSSLIRLSATRALVAHAGADQAWNSGDEGAYLVDEIGGGARVEWIPLGRVRIPRLARLDHETALASVEEPENGIVLLTRLGRANDATALVGLESSGAPLVLDSRRFVAEDPLAGVAVVRLNRRGVAEVQPIETEFPVVPAQTLVLSQDRLLLSSKGANPDHVDDNLQYVVELGDPIQVKPISTPNVPADDLIRAWPYVPQRVRLSATRAVVLGLANGRDDDEILVLDDLGGDPTATPIQVGPLFTGASGAPVALGKDGVAVRIGGQPSWLALIRNLGSTPSVVTVPLDDTGQPPTWIPPATLVDATEGATSQPEDEAVALIHPFEAAPAIDLLPVPFVRRESQGRGQGPLAMGNGRVLLANASEAAGEPGSHEGFAIALGFSGDLRLATESVDLAVRGRRTTRGDATASFSLPDPSLFAAADLEVRLGEAVQMIPAKSIAETPDGFLYRDPTGSKGFFRRVEYRVAEQKLILRGRSSPAAGRVRRPSSAGVIVSVESTELYAAESVAAARLGNRIVYPAP